MAVRDARDGEIWRTPWPCGLHGVVRSGRTHVGEGFPRPPQYATTHTRAPNTFYTVVLLGAGNVCVCGEEGSVPLDILPLLTRFPPVGAEPLVRTSIHGVHLLHLLWVS